MWHMPGRNVVPGRIAMALLIIEKHISVESAEKLTLIESAQKQGLINTNIPGP